MEASHLSWSERSCWYWQTLKSSQLLLDVPAVAKYIEIYQFTLKASRISQQVGRTVLLFIHSILSRAWQIFGDAQIQHFWWIYSFRQTKHKQSSLAFAMYLFTYLCTPTVFLAFQHGSCRTPSGGPTMQHQQSEHNWRVSLPFVTIWKVSLDLLNSTKTSNCNYLGPSL